MSRCFPYPLPGYTLSKASNGALIDSIKLQSGREKAKVERKKEKKEKKREKKGKAEKVKQTKAGHFDHDVFGGDSRGNVKGGSLMKEQKDDSEQLERSGITEEHEQPVCSQNPGYSSDSTENSSKCKRRDLPLSRTRIQGNILRIRLPAQKHIQHDIKDRDEQPCSTSGRIDKAAEHKNNAIRADPDISCSASLATDFVVHGFPLRPDKELSQTNSLKQHDITSLEIVHANTGSKRYKKLKRVAERYEDLMRNWIPPSQLSDDMVIDDEDWLFGRKHQEKQPDKKVRFSSEMSCSSSPSLWPRAHYFTDADIYALPYTIPF